MKIQITNEGGFYSHASITDDGCGRGVEAHDQATLHGDVQDKIIASIDAGETQGTVVIGGESMTWVIVEAS